MQKLKQNSRLAFAGLLLAVFALFAIVNLDTFATHYDIVYDAAELIEPPSSENSFHKSLSFIDKSSSACAFLETRRPNRQVHFRQMRESTTHGFFGRTTSVLDKISNTAVKTRFSFSGKLSGYPSPAFFCTAKDYYVYTLKRILC